MRRRVTGDEWGSVGVERVAAWVLVVLAVGFAAAVATGLGASVATDAPVASFEGTYDGDANALSVTHTGGNPIRGGSTHALVVVVSDDETTNAANLTWVSDAGPDSAFPVDAGDALTVDDAFVDSDADGDRFDAAATVGFELDAGDEVRVVWRGRPLGAPGEISRTLARLVVSDA